MIISKLQRICAWIDKTSESIGRLVAWLTLVMVLTMFSIVVLRYGFQMGWIAMQETVTFMHAMVFLVGAGYTLKHDGHVRVDIFYRSMSPRGKAWVDLLGTLLLLVPTCAFIFWVSWEYVADAWSLREGSREPGGLPGVFLLKTFILIMAALLLLQGLVLGIRSLLLLLGRAQAPSDVAAHETEA